jgi:hypothetical protein
MHDCNFIYVHKNSVPIFMKLISIEQNMFTHFVTGFHSNETINEETMDTNFLNKLWVLLRQFSWSL